MNAGHVILVIIIIVSTTLSFCFYRLSQRRSEQKKGRDEYTKKQIVSALKEKKVCVVIRTHDGRKTDLESSVIQHLTQMGVRVANLSAENASRIWKQESDIGINGADIIFVGSLRQYQNGTGFWHDVIDFRALNNTGAEILGAEVVDELRDYVQVSWSIIETIARILATLK